MPTKTRQRPTAASKSKATPRGKVARPGTVKANAKTSAKTPVPAKGRKTTAAASTKATTKSKAKATAEAPHPMTGRTRDQDVFGFQIGSDSSLIANALVEGGADRGDINTIAAAAISRQNGITTRSGGTKNVPSLVSGVLNRLTKEGYSVESSFVLIPPAEVAAVLKKEAAAAKRAATRKSKTGK